MPRQHLSTAKPSRTRALSLLSGLALFTATLALGSGCVTRQVYVVDRDPAPPTAPTTSAPAAGPVAYQDPPVVDDVASVDEFYEPLNPYGRWYPHARYGYVFVPSTTVVGTGWRPYTRGHWEYTEWGWTWVSAEPFGWATGHYGRWFYDVRLGWVWVPGTRWAPAWVSWRTGGGYVGWAPMPPGAYYGSNYSVYDTSWTFVSYDNFGNARITTVIVTGNRYNDCLRVTRRNSTTVTVRGDSYYRGPDPANVRDAGGSVRHRPLRDVDNDRPTTRPPSDVVVRRGRRSDGGDHTGSVGSRDDRDGNRGDRGDRGRDDGRDSVDGDRRGERGERYDADRGRDGERYVDDDRRGERGDRNTADRNEGSASDDRRGDRGERDDGLNGSRRDTSGRDSPGGENRRTGRDDTADDDRRGDRGDANRAPSRERGERYLDDERRGDDADRNQAEYQREDSRGGRGTNVVTEEDRAGNTMGSDRRGDRGSTSPGPTTGRDTSGTSSGGRGTNVVTEEDRAGSTMGDDRRGDTVDRNGIPARRDDNRPSKPEPHQDESMPTVRSPRGGVERVPSNVGRPPPRASTPPPSARTPSNASPSRRTTTPPPRSSPSRRTTTTPSRSTSPSRAAPPSRSSSPSRSTSPSRRSSPSRAAPPSRSGPSRAAPPTRSSPSRKAPAPSKSSSKKKTKKDDDKDKKKRSR